MNLAGRNVLVVGLGRSGRAAVRLAKKEGAYVAASDAASREDLAEALGEVEPLLEQVETGEHTPALFRWADLVVVSPGVPLRQPVFEVARAAGAEIIGEVELAFRFLDCPLIGITGTNGKSTTTALVGAMLKAAGRKVFVGGNFGDPLIEAAEKGSVYDFVVAELSSFQLEGIKRLRPSIGAMLNVTPDHLNRYDNFDAYVRAKARIFENQLPSDAAVMNAADHNVMAQMPRVHGRMYTFGLSYAHAWIEGDTLRLSSDNFADSINIEDFQLPGEHNRLNLQAAALMTRLAGADAEAIGLAATTFTGLKHRLEVIGERDGVLFINDSKATTADSVATAVAAMDKPVILILGGRDKGADWAELEYKLLKKVRAVVAYGEAAEAIAERMEMTPIRVVKPFAEALEEACNLAQTGEVVLLSPGCASFDQFSNFEARGEAMREWMQKR